MADKRISQLAERVDIANNDVVAIVASGATATNKATISSIQSYLQTALDVGVTSVGVTIGESGSDVNVVGSPITTSGNITINIPSAGVSERGVLTSEDYTSFLNKQNTITLTTSGTSGDATFDGSLLNIPNYTTDTSGFVTLGTNQAISGTKTFNQDSSFNGVSIGRGGGNENTNTRVGVNALLNNTTGSTNTAIGYDALLSNISGISNTANGFDALRNNTTGSTNTAIGVNALRGNTTGISNTAIGGGALLFNTEGSSNTAIGREAGRRLADNTNLTIANDSIFIGNNTKANADNQTNQIVIGHTAVGLGTNTTVLGNIGTSYGRWFGNLLLGDSNNSGEQLQVTGTARITGALNGTSAVFSGGVNLATVSGNVGIGTTSPESGFKLDVAGFAAIGAVQGNSRLYLFGSSTANGATFIQARNLSVATPLHFFSSVNYFQNNVGIGMEFPNTALTIRGNTSASQSLSMSAGAASPVQLAMSNGFGARQGVVFVNNGSSANTSFGIISENTALTIKTAAHNIGDTSDLTTGWTERLRITSTGNVGIGTTTPSAKLDVNGAIKTSSPSGSSAQPFKIGSVSTTTDVYGGQILNVEINGLNYRLMIAEPVV